FYLYVSIEHLDLHSFPTRRSSDLRGLQLMRLNTFKDLGVVFDSQLSFQAHIDSLISSASKTLGFIMRTSRFFSSIKLLRTLYFADRKSTRLNSSHVSISYAVFSLK